MLINDKDYFEVLNKIINCIESAQYKVMVGANLELLHRNWKIGNYINSNQN